MPQYASRILSSLVSLVLLLVMVFFLSPLNGDPAALFLPIDATPEMIEQFRELHGLNDPLIVQFGRYVWDVLHLDFGDSLRQAVEQEQTRTALTAAGSPVDFRVGDAFESFFREDSARLVRAVQRIGKVD